MSLESLQNVTYSIRSIPFYHGYETVSCILGEQFSLILYTSGKDNAKKQGQLMEIILVRLQFTSYTTSTNIYNASTL